MIPIPNSDVIISACPKLIWMAYRDNELIDKLRTMQRIDKAIKSMICDDNKEIKMRDAELPSGLIDGMIDINGEFHLVYVNPSARESPMDYHLLHAQSLMHESTALSKKGNKLTKCLLLTVNKLTGDVSTEVMAFNPEFVIDYESIANEPVCQIKNENDACFICKFRGECGK
ncbi:hypothetical protein vBYenSP400_72 [Yersinia phage vB_YenS_P400]|nr:hypothetical protein vBYenSP400_72 [Yersinia phage vB_YenS_P400]